MMETEKMEKPAPVQVTLSEEDMQSIDKAEHELFLAKKDVEAAKQIEEMKRLRSENIFLKICIKYGLDPSRDMTMNRETRIITMA
jgi:hypothetical protein